MIHLQFCNYYLDVFGSRDNKFELLKDIYSVTTNEMRLKTRGMFC